MNRSVQDQKNMENTVTRILELAKMARVEINRVDDEQRGGVWLTRYGTNKDKKVSVFIVPSSEPIKPAKTLGVYGPKKVFT